MILEPFAGPGGASLGIHTLGLEAVGIEWDRDACATRAAAGLPTIRADVASFPLAHLRGKVTGCWLSPPCPTFSTAGKGEGRDELPWLYSFTEKFHRHGWTDPWTHHQWSDPRTPLVLEPLRFVDELEPDWVCCEQVPPVVELWEAFAHVLSERGYSVWAGVLNCADLGVPQTRKRAVLLASKVRVVHPPEATHAKDPEPGLFGTLEPWVSMADALGWSGRVGFPRLDDRGDSPDGYRERDWRSTEEPAFNLTEKARSWVVQTGANTMKHNRNPEDVVPYERPVTEPAPTLDGKAGSAWRLRHSFGESSPDSWTDHLVATDARGWCWERPATTVAGDPQLSPPGWRGRPEDYTEDGTYTGERSMDNAIRLTIEEALILQGFPPDYPVQGSRTSQFQQVGNAVPPPLAAACVRQVTHMEEA